jgi:hypothetical protein
MLVSLIVLGGGVYGIALAFRQSTEVTDRSAAAAQAEVGFQTLTRDLRNAAVCPSYVSGSTTSYPTGAGGQQVSGLLVSAGPTVQFCAPVPGSHTTDPPAEALFTWTCNTASSTESCTRSWQPLLCPVSSGSPTAASTSCSIGAPYASSSSSTTKPIYGVTSINLTGLVSGANATLTSDASCTSSSGYWSYSLLSNGSCPLSWVGINASVANLTDPSNPAGSSNQQITQNTSPISVQTGAELRNFGI